MWTKAYLSIGTNMGDRLANLKQAVRLLERRPEIEVTSISSVYEGAKKLARSGFSRAIGETSSITAFFAMALISTLRILC